MVISDVFKHVCPPHLASGFLCKVTVTKIDGQVRHLKGVYISSMQAAQMAVNSFGPNVKIKVEVLNNG